MTRSASIIRARLIAQGLIKPSYVPVKGKVDPKALAARQREARRVVTA